MTALYEKQRFDTIQEHGYFLSSNDLLNPDKRNSVPTDQHITIDISQLLTYADSERFDVLKFLAKRTGNCSFVHSDGKAIPAHNAFDAVLAIIRSTVRPGDSASSILSIRLAVEAAVVLRERELDTALQDAAECLAACHVANAGIRVLKQKADELCVNIASLAASIVDAIPDAPLNRDARIPTGWRLSEQGIYTPGRKGRLVIPAPMFIAGAINRPDGGIDWQLSCRYDQQWRQRSIDRGSALSSRKLAELATFGFPITSSNASAAVQYLIDYERENQHAIPKLSQRDRQGWDDSLHEFLLGPNLHTPQGVSEVVIADRDPALKWPAKGVCFQGDDGQQQMLNAFSKSGSFDEWRSLMRLVEPFYRIRLGIYASLSAPLIRFFDVSNFVLEYCCPTSQGKTTTLRIIASLFGCPDPRSEYSLLGTWDATRVHIERGATICSDLPLILDDTKRAKHRDDVAKKIYDYSSGRGRGRANLTGLQTTSTASGVLLMSGESPAVNLTPDGGTLGRTVEITGLPLNEVSPEAGNLAQQLREGLSQHYGHAGPLFIQALVHMPQSERNFWKKELHQLQIKYRSRAGNNNVYGRLTESLAVMTIAAEIAGKAGIFPWEYHDPVEPLWDELVSTVQSCDVIRQALEYLCSWAVSNRLGFFSGGKDKPKFPPPQGWHGRWDWEETTSESVSASPRWKGVGFMKDRFKDVLQRGGFEADAIEQGFRQRDWLVTNHGRYQKERVDGPDCPMLMIKREAFELTSGSCSHVAQREKSTADMGAGEKSPIATPKPQIVRDPDALAALAATIAKAAEVVIDLETSSLDHRSGVIVGIGVAVENDTYYVPIHHRDETTKELVTNQLPLNRVLNELRLDTKKLIAHNAKYELKWLRKDSRCSLHFSWDTLLAERLRHSNEAADLKATAIRELGVPAWELSKAELERIEYLPIERVAEYCSKDCWYTHLICQRQRSDWAYEFLMSEVELPLLPVVAEMEDAGYQVDIEYFRRLQQKLEPELETTLSQIREMIGNATFNPDSNQQLRALLFSQLGEEPTRLTKKGRPATDATVLSKFAGKHAVVALILKYKKLKKLLGTYCGIPHKVGPDHRLRVEFNQLAADTGRFASKSVIQTLPRNDDYRIREGFVAPPGHQIVRADFVQQELCVLAHVSGDKALRRAVCDGVDLHGLAAVRVFKLDCQPSEVKTQYKCERDKVKAIQFGLIYGRSASSLAKELQVSLPEAESLISNYFSEFPDVERLVERTHRQVQEQGYVDDMFGRRRYLPDAQLRIYAGRSARHQEGWSRVNQANRAAQNFVIQGPSATITKLAMLGCHSHIQQVYGDSVKLVLTLHDELQFEVREDVIDQFAGELPNLMCQLGLERFGFTIPLTVEVAVGPSWGQTALWRVT